MSEPIPESVPTSADPRSRRPTKKRALTPVSAQQEQVEALFAHPEREVQLPKGAKQRTVAPPPDIVANVQGSSAGAGSGEFHVYKASRRREYERLRLMEEQVKKEEEEREFGKKIAEQKAKDAAKTNKNRARREKLKQRKAKKGQGSAEDGEHGEEGKTGLNPRPPPAMNGVEKDDSAMNSVDGAPANGADEMGIVIHDED